MSTSFLRFARSVTTLIAVMIACGASFVVGYRAGYQEGWTDAWTKIDLSRMPPIPGNWFNQNKSGR